MNLQISPSNLIGEIVAPPSKSYAHRLIICCCLFNRQCVIKNVGVSTDILTTIDCVKNMGANFEYNGNDFYFKSFSKKEKAILNCNESGSTLRFLLPIACALSIKAQFLGSDRLFSRPNDLLVESLNKYGAKIENFNVNGSLIGDYFEVDGSISSQYISGYLMALALFDKKCTLKVNGDIVSENYIDITIDVLSKFGIVVERQNNIFVIYKSKNIFPKDLVNEGDFSNSAFWLVAGCIGGKISVSGLNINSKQGDSKIIEILNQFGANVKREKNKICVSKSELKGSIIDCKNIPDLVQILCVLACFSNGKTILQNTNRLKYKESDRVLAIEKMLNTANISYTITENSIEIVGGNASAGNFLCNNDHRTAMSNTILATFLCENSKIINAECVEKSYPEFFEHYKLLGGKANVIV